MDEPKKPDRRAITSPENGKLGAEYGHLGAEYGILGGRPPEYDTEEARRAARVEATRRWREKKRLEKQKAE